MTASESSLLLDLRLIAEAAAKYPGATVRLEPKGLVVEVARTVDGQMARGEQAFSWMALHSMVEPRTIIIGRLQFLHAAVLQQTTKAGFQL